MLTCFLPSLLSQGGRRGQIHVPSTGSDPPGCQVITLGAPSHVSKKKYIDATRKNGGISQKCLLLLLLRATALLLSVSHLVLVTRNACHMSGSMDWIDQSLHAAEDHMVVLREAALASEPERSMPGADTQREQAI